MIPFSIILAGLDPNYKHYGFNVQAFLEHFESKEFEDRRCTMVRKGTSISTIKRNGPQSIVVSPYGINENMVDIYNVIPLINSTQIPENNFKANIKFVEDNTFYWKNILKKFNYNILRHLNFFLYKYFNFKIDYIKNEMYFTSIFKYLNGNPHEAHSYLLE